MAAIKELPRTRALAAKIVFAAMVAIKRAGGELPRGEVLAELERSAQLDDWERGLQKNGQPRWRMVLGWYSNGYVKAGFIRKQAGIWQLTRDGEAALSRPPEEISGEADKAYWAWQEKNRPPGTEPAGAEEEPTNERVKRKFALEEAVQQAADSIRVFVDALNPYEFQDLVGALLRGMGYFTPYVAPPGKDGGTDIIAYRDPLGTLSPRIRVQVKHREQKASSQEVQQLMGILKGGDVGMFVSTSGFSPDAKAAARSSAVHVELVDFDRLTILWQQFYDKMADEDKVRLPLRAVYFLAPDE